MTTRNELEKIQHNAEDEVNRWSDPRFGGIDVIGHQGGRDFTATQVGNDETTDPRFAPLDDRGSIRSLRSAVEQLARDPQVREQVAHETGNLELLENLDKERAEVAVFEFRRANPDYWKSEANWEQMVWRLAKTCLGWANPEEDDPHEVYAELLKTGNITTANLTAAFSALMRAGKLEVNPDLPRPLDERQRRAIALQAASGDVEGAVTRYLQHRLPEQVSEMWMYSLSPLDALDDIADPKYKSVLSEAVWFSWENGRPSYSPTPERRHFLKEWIGNRIPTARLLDTAWEECQRAEKDATRAQILGQVERQYTLEDPAEQLDGLDDATLDNLYHRTLQHYACRGKSTGVLA